MCPKYTDLEGQKFGRLTVLRQEETKQGGTRWRCLCDCGNETIVEARKLKSGHTRSCGCYRREKTRMLNFVHGATCGGRQSSLWTVHHDMLRRCYNKNDSGYKNYGARGITVCDKWRYNFIAFRDDMLSLGWCAGLEIDRINNDGIYELSNVRCVTRKENARNKRTCRFITYNGERLTVKEWAEKANICYRTLLSRLNRGWDLERSLTTPLKEIHSYD